MIPVIDRNDKRLYEQIYEFYREAILQRQLKPDQRLPSYRVLARELGVGNNTVLKAYEQLILEGYVKNEHRRGLFAARVDAAEWELHPPQKRAPPVRAAKPAEPVFNTASRLVDEHNFPIKQWRKCSHWAMDRVSFQYPEYENDEPLKEQLIKYLFSYRGVRATPGQLLIGSGASALMFWLAFVMRTTFSRIVVEDPGYARVRSLFAAFGYKVKPVPVSHDGIDVKRLASEKADLVYLTPSHQYPTGGAIPVSNRMQILRWAMRNNAYVIEDDFDCEFRYKTKLMPSLQALDKSNRVLYVGTFSSALMPSLRVAYMVLPLHFPVPHASFSYLTHTVPYFTRQTLAYFMEKGYWERHLKRMRKIYKHKYDACVRALGKIPKKHIQFNDAPSGLNILLRLNTRLSEAEVIRRAREAGIVVTATREFFADKANLPRHPQVLFEFGSLPEQAIEKVVAKLHHVWF